MQKCVALLLAVFVLIGVFCGCSQTPGGSDAELTRCAWTADLDGGGKISLRFAEDNAALTLENGGERQEIAGVYVADETELLIFDRACQRHYAFSYVPKGETLELSYQGKTVSLKADSGIK